MKRKAATNDVKMWCFLLLMFETDKQLLRRKRENGNRKNIRAERRTVGGRNDCTPNCTGNHTKLPPLRFLWSFRQQEQAASKVFVSLALFPFIETAPGSFIPCSHIPHSRRSIVKRIMENSIMETAQDGDVVTNKENRVVYSVIWILLLFLVVWPLGWFLAPIWIVLLAGEAFIPQGKKNIF